MMENLKYNRKTFLDGASFVYGEEANGDLRIHKLDTTPDLDNLTPYAQELPSGRPVGVFIIWRKGVGEDLIFHNPYFDGVPVEEHHQKFDADYVAGLDVAMSINDTVTDAPEVRADWVVPKVERWVEVTRTNTALENLTQKPLRRLIDEGRIEEAMHYCLASAGNGESVHPLR
jgi:hypothetical protein